MKQFIISNTEIFIAVLEDFNQAHLDSNLVEYLS